MRGKTCFATLPAVEKLNLIVHEKMRLFPEKYHLLWKLSMLLVPNSVKLTPSQQHTKKEFSNCTSKWEVRNYVQHQLNWCQFSGGIYLWQGQ